jgi:hypothetical protein
MKDATRTDNWMPQLLQDIITGDLARYSAMTVLDRSNEQLVVAEQSLSVSGNYSDNDYIKIGNLTNAQYIVAGNILKVGGNYAITFRINSTETNEIRASFNKTYPLQDIERGLAPKEAVRELLAGMGIELTQAGEVALLTIPETEVKATARLAQGMAAEKSDNLVEALAFYTEAIGMAPGMKEASAHIQNFGGTIQTGSIRERAEQAQKERAKWEKIFSDLVPYVKDNLAMAVYDFSTVTDSINSSLDKVSFKISPGIQIVPNRTILLVWKTVFEKWREVQSLEENKSWAKNIAVPYKGGGSDREIAEGVIWLTYSVDIGFYDDYGDRIDQGRLSGSGFQFAFNAITTQIVTQHKYFDPKKYQGVSSSSIPIADITDNVVPKVERVYFYWSRSRNTDNKEYVNAPMMTVAEWEQWLVSQGGR